MQTTLLPTSASHPLRTAVKVSLMLLMVWTALSLLYALLMLKDDLQQGLRSEFWTVFHYCSICIARLLLVGGIIYAVFTRWPNWTRSTWRLVSAYLLLLACVLPPQMLYLVRLYVAESGSRWSWDMIESQVEAVDHYASLFNFWAVSTIFFGVAALKIWQQHQLRTRAWEQAQRDQLQLRLSLEKQRSMALRAQLEPHFLFNALNAISALVRRDNKTLALDGLHELAQLLRYTLTAGERERSTLGEELDFVHEYLKLQILRFGDRLQVHFSDISPAVRQCLCPPLVLQPLIENAIRHDLECHELASDIRVDIGIKDQQLVISISNPVQQIGASNPGTGLGLRAVRERLQLEYADRASLSTHVDQGRFIVQLSLPYEHA